MADFAPSRTQGRSGATAPPPSRTRKSNTPIHAHTTSHDGGGHDTDLIHDSRLSVTVSMATEVSRTITTVASRWRLFSMHEQHKTNELDISVSGIAWGKSNLFRDHPNTCSNFVTSNDGCNNKSNKPPKFFVRVERSDVDLFALKVLLPMETRFSLEKNAQNL